MSRNSTWAAVVTSRQQICEVVPFWREHDCIEVEWWRPWGLVDVRRALTDASGMWSRGGVSVYHLSVIIIVTIISVGRHILGLQ